METSIQTIIQTQTGSRHISLFGYSTKGLPGVEIHGLKSRGRLIKEKIIYLTRRKKIKVPLLRFCLCVDTELKIDKELQIEFKNLEIPFLLMFWHLAGILPIAKLDDCVASGTFDVKGRFRFNRLEPRAHCINIGIGECVEASGLLSEIPNLEFVLDR